jgi:hypothetical protein
MTREELQELFNGGVVNVGEYRNRIFLYNNRFIVEFYDYTTSITKLDMYKVGPMYYDVEDAITVAQQYTAEQYNRYIKDVDKKRLKEK